MKVATLKVLLFVALLAVPSCSRLLTESNVEEQPVVENPAPENQPAPVDQPEVAPENKEAEVKAPEAGPVEAKAEGAEAKPAAVEAQAPAEKEQTPAPEKKRSNVGLFILIGVSVLGVIAIGTTFILGKQKH